MPRRDVVLTGLIAFGAGVAVGANWKKLGRKLAPLMEKWGLQMADLSEIISAATTEDFIPAARPASAKAKSRRPRRAKVSAENLDEIFAPSVSRRNGKQTPFPAVHPSSKRKSPRRKPSIVTASAEPANGTYGA